MGSTRGARRPRTARLTCNQTNRIAENVACACMQCSYAPVSGWPPIPPPTASVAIPRPLDLNPPFLGIQHQSHSRWSCHGVCSCRTGACINWCDAHERKQGSRFWAESPRQAANSMIAIISYHITGKSPHLQADDIL